MTIKEPLIIIDAHVHIYDCFPLSKFLDAAYANCRNEALRRQHGGEFTGVLLLTESSGDQWFQQLGSYADKNETLGDASSGRWRFYRTDESCSLYAKSTNDSNLYLVAGRQIVTREKLEVLALMTNQNFPDGTILQDTLETIRSYQGIPVIPWGVGKWWGKRGRILSDLMPSQTSKDFFLGDNSSRPSFLPYPPQFSQAGGLGIRILPGSDPLPISAEYWRPCTVGFCVIGSLHADRPATDLRSWLRDDKTELSPYIKPENWSRFFKNQLAMKMMKHRSPNHG